MRKEIPVDSITDFEIKPIAYRKGDKTPIIIARRLFNRVIQDQDAISKMASNEDILLNNIFKSLYEEDKKYWPNGLSKDLYDGEDDLLYLLTTKEDESPIGFVARQVRGKGTPEGRASYYSIGVLPEFRGKGVAKEALLNLLNQKPVTKKHFYTVHKDNKGSLALYSSLAKEHPELQLKVFD